jgi:lysophospholipase L1-like esterase
LLGDASSGAATGGAGGSGGMAAISTEACGKISVDAAAVDHAYAGRIVVLGSSTAAGQNASSADKAWVERYRGYLAEEFPNFAVDNLAMGGFNSYRIQASDYVPPSGRPLPMAGNNITTALEKWPDAIIINLPSNDEYEGFPLEEQLANYQRVTELAQASGVLVWIATAQPRDFAEPEKRQDLLDAKDAIQERFAPRAIDFWSHLANPDGTMKSSYNSGDGTHFNDAGHAVLVQLVVSCAIPEVISSSGQ